MDPLDFKYVGKSPVKSLHLFVEMLIRVEDSVVKVEIPKTVSVSGNDTSYWMTSLQVMEFSILFLLWFGPLKNLMSYNSFILLYNGNFEHIVLHITI